MLLDAWTLSRWSSSMKYFWKVVFGQKLFWNDLWIFFALAIQYCFFLINYPSIRKLRNNHHHLAGQNLNNYKKLKKKNRNFFEIIFFNKKIGRILVSISKGNKLGNLRLIDSSIFLLNKDHSEVKSISFALKKSVHLKWN